MFLCVIAVKVPLDAYMMDFVFSEREDGGIFDNNYGMDYHIPVFGGVTKEPPTHIVHIAVEMAPIAKACFMCLSQFMVINVLFRHYIEYMNNKLFYLYLYLL